jgi:hypothetical protein
VATLLMKLRPGEKRQCGRWRPGWRYQKGPGRGFLFRLAKMGQNSIDDVLVLNTSDDSDRAYTASTDLDVDIEYSLESSCSDHCCVTLCLCPRLGIGDLLQRLTISGRCDSPMPA